MSSFAYRRRDDASTQPRDPLGALSRSASGQDSLANHVTSEKEPGEITVPLDQDSLGDALPTARPVYLELSTASDDPVIVTSILKAITAYPPILEPPFWMEYQLDVCHLDLLIHRLEECGKSEKLRCEYFSRSGTFVHQMSSYAHDLCASQFSRYVYRKLLDLASSPEEKAFVEQMVDCRSADARAPNNNSKDFHQPDTFFIHSLSPNYGLCLEVAHAQKRARLAELAEFYILDSERETQILIGIDFDTNRSKKATLLTWRRDGGNLRAHVQELRSEDGTLVLGDPVRISMFDLAPRDLVPLSMQGKTLEFSVQDLCEILDLADSVQARVNGLQRTKNSAPVLPTPAALQSHDE